MLDMHTHFFPSEWPDFARRFGSADWPSLRIDDPDSGRGMIMLGDREFRPVIRDLWDLDSRLEAMDRDGIETQVICATPLMFGYSRPIEEALDCAKFCNDAALEFCRESDGRVLPLCQVPLQDIDAACEELSRCRTAGHLGVQIGNHVQGRNLDDEGLVAFLQHCAREGAAVLVHPWDMMARERMPKYMLQWLVAMPAETQLSILSLILSGAFERLPQELRLCFAHGGGSFIYLLGRVDNAWRHRDIVREDCPHPPSHYVDRFFVDSAIFDEGALRLMVDVMGPDRIVLGSDYPFPLGEQQVGSLVQGTDRLSAEEKRKIVHDNPRRWLALQ